MTSRKSDELTFEQSLAELETIVQRLEQGELGLEESMALFEQGLSLSKNSQEMLSNAQQKVKILLSENGDNELTDFEPAE